METLCRQFMAPASQNGGIKILDFSEVPSDILPLIVSLLTLLLSVQQWTDRAESAHWQFSAMKHTDTFLPMRSRELNYPVCRVLNESQRRGANME